MDHEAFLKWLDKVGINNIIWCTDLDHTVLDMKKDAAKVTAPDGLEDIFHDLDTKTEGRFFIITGREMSYVDSIFPKAMLKTSTEYHNVMRWNLNEAAEELTNIPQWNLIDHKLQKIIKKYWPEEFQPRDKPFMRSLHFQSAAAFSDNDYKAAAKAEIQTVLDDYFTQTGQRLTNIDGGQVFDIAPEGSSKAFAMQDIISYAKSLFPERDLRPVYFGDSPGDLPAAPIVQKAGGKFVSVGNNKQVVQAADFQLQTTQECRELFLEASLLKPKVPRFITSPNVARPELP